MPSEKFGGLIPGSYLSRLSSFMYKLAYVLKTKLLSEVNLYSVALCLEHSGLVDARLPVLLLYSNMLEFAVSRRRVGFDVNSADLYQLIDKDTLASLLYVEDRYQNDFTKSILE